ncbi:MULTISPECIES: FlhB-like flagellar biosynthesis protein [Bacillus]|uniref:FlhB-like flagellar biosynthesis protein n=1 Tax=Bacillus TaxID=1386 RepID=UPI00041BE1F4|nr:MULTISPECIES: FlhB-like flagellar biosynthesis protein [Bacillus]QHZ46785.1 FlhB-like flagellar biosynthesis protein [Bacillus sp. NSP9.1]WFA06919.1 FlhB-like flagellar biosynthesis protein [Bacillus sp. HSf4]
MKESAPLRKAVALHYDEMKDKAPKVVAKGSGYTAEKIIEEAQKAGVPIQEDPTLVELMRHLELDDHIPEELYEIVAEIFSFIYTLDDRMKNRE